MDASAKIGLSHLVERILKAKYADPNVDTRAVEAEIDRIVYELYRLTEAEIAAVEGPRPWHRTIAKTVNSA